MIREFLKHALMDHRPQRCPICDESVPAEHINLQEGVALCPQCGTLSRLSELSFRVRSLPEILERTPPGCSVEHQGQSVIASASCRSLSGFLGGAAVALFWNSIVSVFVTLAFASLYTNLVGPLPAWFPGLDGGKPNMNGQPMELNMALFLCLFLTPFVLVGSGMIGYVLMCVLGKVVVVLDEFDSYTAVGIGFFRWKRRFDARQVQFVKLGKSSWNSNSPPHSIIELAADRTIKFGSLLPAERMEWLMAVLKDLLQRPAGDRRTTKLPWLQ